MYHIQIDIGIILLIIIDIKIVMIALKKDIVLKVQDRFFESGVLKNEKEVKEVKRSEGRKKIHPEQRD